MASPAHHHLTANRPERDHSVPAELGQDRQVRWCARPHRYPAESIAPDASSIFGRLTLDWIRTTALTDSGVTLTERWATREAVLGESGCTSLPELMDAIDQAPRVKADALLAALLRLHQAGDEMAGQLLLMQMLPGLSGLVGRHGSDAEREDLRGEVVAAFWEVITSHRCDDDAQSIAAGLKLTTLRKVRDPRIRRYEEMEAPSGHPTDGYVDEAVAEVAPRRYAAAMLQRDLGAPDVSDVVVAMLEPLGPDIDLLSLLAQAAAHEVISMEDAQLLARMDCPTEGQSRSSTDVGRELGLSPTAARARRSRAIRRLKAWVAPVVDGAVLTVA